MDRHVLVALLKTVVLADVMQIVTTDHDRVLHLHLDDNACQDAATDAYIASEWALLVDVMTINSLKK